MILYQGISLVVLAAVDGWGLAQWIIGGMFGLAMAYVRSIKWQIGKLKEDLKSAADMRIDEKFKVADERVDAKYLSLQSKIGEGLAPMLRQMEEICERLKEGDGTFERLGERDHKLEIKLLQAMSDLNEFIRESCATKKELENLNHRVNALGDKVSEVTGAVNGLRQERRRA